MQVAMSFRRESGQSPAQKDPRRVAWDIIDQLNAWASECPRYRRSLHDCAEEIAWVARLGLARAVAPAETTPLKYGAKQIVTTLHLWAELYPALTRSLLSCVEEIEQVAAVRARKDDAVRARDLVLLSFEGAVLQTSKEISSLTGLALRRVNRALVRLRQLGLVRDAGCAAQCHEDGYRLRQYKLTHTRAAA
jgi:hypothetical protein